MRPCDATCRLALLAFAFRKMHAISRIFGQSLSRRIVAARVKRMAPANPSQAAPGSTNRPIFLHRQDEIGAARRLETAMPADQRAQRPLIDPRRRDQQHARADARFAAPVVLMRLLSGVICAASTSPLNSLGQRWQSISMQLAQASAEQADRGTQTRSSAGNSCLRQAETPRESAASNDCARPRRQLDAKRSVPAADGPIRSPRRTATSQASAAEFRAANTRSNSLARNRSQPFRKADSRSLQQRGAVAIQLIRSDLCLSSTTCSRLRPCRPILASGSNWLERLAQLLDSSAAASRQSSLRSSGPVACQPPHPMPADHRERDQEQPDQRQRQQRHDDGRAPRRIEPLQHRLDGLLRRRASRPEPKPDADRRLPSQLRPRMLRMAVRDVGQLLPLFVRQILRQVRFGSRQTGRPAADSRPHAVAFDPQPLAARCVRRHRQRDRAVRRRHVDLRALRRLGQRHRHAHFEPIAGAAKMRMRADVNREQDIAGRRIARRPARPGREGESSCRRRCRPES